VQQACNRAMIIDHEIAKLKYLLRDRENTFVQEFDAI
jgi:hypothetical protein